MAQFMKLLVTIAITTAITIAIIATTRTTATTTTSALEDSFNDRTPLRAIKIRPSRFLTEKVGVGQRPKARNPKAADHCKKDKKICSSSLFSTGKNARMACCNNKCIDLSTDNNNCGVCKNKCKFGQTCCRGRCVYVAFDKRHCGKCNNRCNRGAFCVYGLCNYA